MQPQITLQPERATLCLTQMNCIACHFCLRDRLREAKDVASIRTEGWLANHRVKLRPTHRRQNAASPLFLASGRRSATNSAGAMAGPKRRTS